MWMSLGRWLLTQWTWVWANSKRQWKTMKLGMLQSMGSQRVRHNWATEQQQQPGVHLTLSWCWRRDQSRGRLCIFSHKVDRRLRSTFPYRWAGSGEAPRQRAPPHTFLLDAAPPCCPLGLCWQAARLPWDAGSNRDQGYFTCLLTRAAWQSQHIRFGNKTEERDLLHLCEHGVSMKSYLYRDSENESAASAVFWA